MAILFGAQLACRHAEAQDIEPRRWSHLPTGSHFIGIGYRYSRADISLDPTLDLDDVESVQQDVVLSTVHAYAWGGKPVRLEFMLPYGAGRWEGLLSGVPASTRRTGLRDFNARISMNLWGVPALSGPAFARWQAEHPVRTTFGIAALVSAPTGEYQEERLLNLGNNRWVVRPQAGVLHTRDRWQFELTGSVSVYGENDAYLETRTQQSDPLWFVQAHVIHTFRPGLWASVSWGRTQGGENRIDDQARDDLRRESYASLSLGLPINPYQGIRLSWIRSWSHRDIGFDSDSMLLGWSVMMGHRPRG